MPNRNRPPQDITRGCNVVVAVVAIVVCFFVFAWVRISIKEGYGWAVILIPAAIIAVLALFLAATNTRRPRKDSEGSTVVIDLTMGEADVLMKCLASASAAGHHENDKLLMELASVRDPIYFKNFRDGSYLGRGKDVSWQIAAGDLPKLIAFVDDAVTANTNARYLPPSLIALPPQKLRDIGYEETMLRELAKTLDLLKR